MALHLVLQDFEAAGGIRFSAGTVLDDAQHGVAALQSSGLASMPYNPALVDGALAGYLAQIAHEVDADLTPLILRSPGGAGAVNTAAGVSVEAALAAIDAADSPVFIFRPGGVAEANVYTDWATLFAKASAYATGGKPVTVLFDGTISVPTVPVGTWDFGGAAEFMSANGIATSVLVDGQLQGFNRLTDCLLVWQGAGAMWARTSSRTGFITFIGTSGLQRVAAATGPVLELSGSGGMVLIGLGNTSLLEFDPTTPAIDCLAGHTGGLTVRMHNRATIGAQALRKSVGTTTLSVTPGVRYLGPLSLITGTLTHTDYSEHPVAEMLGGLLGGAAAESSYLGQSEIALNNATPFRFPAGAPVTRIVKRLSVYVRANTLTTACTATVYVNGVATTVTLSIGAGLTGNFVFTVNVATTPAFVNLAATDQVDVRLENTAGGLGNSILCAAQVSASWNA
jgi:hypothetical protein